MVHPRRSNHVPHRGRTSSFLGFRTISTSTAAFIRLDSALDVWSVSVVSQRCTSPIDDNWRAGSAALPEEALFEAKNRSMLLSWCVEVGFAFALDNYLEPKMAMLSYGGCRLPFFFLCFALLLLLLCFAFALLLVCFCFAFALLLFLLCFALLCFAVLCFALLCFALVCFAWLCFALRNLREALK